MPKPKLTRLQVQTKNKNKLKYTVEALHGARQLLYEASGRLEIQQVLFQQKHSDLIQQVEAAQLAVQENDETLRTIMIEKYNKEVITAIGPGLDIRIRTGIECIAPGEVREWALTHATWLLQLDMSKVEAMAKAIPGSIPSTRTTETPTAYVSKDLSKAIEAFSGKR